MIQEASSLLEPEPSVPETPQLPERYRNMGTPPAWWRGDPYKANLRARRALASKKK